LRRREREYNIASATAFTLAIAGLKQWAVANADSGRTQFRQHSHMAHGQWPVRVE
jgi:hypothetical protein